MVFMSELVSNTIHCDSYVVYLHVGPFPFLAQLEVLMNTIFGYEEGNLRKFLFSQTSQEAYSAFNATVSGCYFSHSSFALKFICLWN